MEHPSGRMVFLMCVRWAFLISSVFANTINAEERQPQMSLDELLAQANNVSSPAGVFHDDNMDFFKVELDIAYSFEEYDALQKANKEEEQEEKHKRTKRTAGLRVTKYSKRRWIDNIVYFQILPHFTGKDVGEILDGIDEWKKHTCLTFKQDNLAKNRIQFKRGRGGCYSRIGMVGGIQDLALGNLCERKSIVIHEMGHALGLHHEQNRPDRDNYVRVNEHNVSPKMMYNFDKRSWYEILNMNIPYDYESIMHYGKGSFSKNGGITIQTIDPKYENIIGQRQSLSFGDIKSINIMYDCKRHKSGCNLVDEQCPGNGFVSRDCTCLCPGDSQKQPTKPCTGKLKPKPPSTHKPECVDYEKECPTWAAKGDCQKRVIYMEELCKKSCNKCDNVTPATPTPDKGGCSDEQEDCSLWAAQGKCRTHKGYMEKHCKKSCHKCVIVTPTTTTPTPDKGGCSDEQEDCSLWAAQGKCRTHKGYMGKHCKKSCQLCNKDTSECKDKYSKCPIWADLGECRTNPEYLSKVCRKSCNLCSDGSGKKPTKTVSRVCEDKKSNCPRLASRGYCSSMKDYMQQNCRKSCQLCSNAGCVDKHHACAKWKEINYCNGRYKNDIQPLCRKSCGLC